MSVRRVARCLLSIFPHCNVAEPRNHVEKVIGLSQNRVTGRGSVLPSDLSSRHLPALLPANVSASRIWSLSETHRNGHTPAVSYDTDLHSVSNLMSIQNSKQIIGVADFRAIERNDDVTESNFTVFGLCYSTQIRLAGA